VRKLPFDKILQTWIVSTKAEQNTSLHKWDNILLTRNYKAKLWVEKSWNWHQGSISPTYLRTAFTPVAPKIVIIQSSCQYLSTLLGSMPTGAKAALRTLMKLTPGRVVVNIEWKPSRMMNTKQFFIERSYKIDKNWLRANYMLRKCQIIFTRKVRQTSSGVNFTNVLRAAFTLLGPKSAKWHCWLDCLFLRI